MTLVLLLNRADQMMCFWEGASAMELLFWWNFVEAGLCDLDKKEMRFSFDLTKVFPIWKNRIDISGLQI